MIDTWISADLHEMPYDTLVDGLVQTFEDLKVEVNLDEINENEEHEEEAEPGKEKAKKNETGPPQDGAANPDDLTDAAKSPEQLSNYAEAKIAAIKNIQKALTQKILERLDDGRPLVSVARKMKVIVAMIPQIQDMERRLGILQTVEPILEQALTMLRKVLDFRNFPKIRYDKNGDIIIPKPQPPPKKVEEYEHRAQLKIEKEVEGVDMDDADQYNSDPDYYDSEFAPAEMAGDEVDDESGNPAQKKQKQEAKKKQSLHEKPKKDASPPKPIQEKQEPKQEEKKEEEPFESITEAMEKISKLRESENEPKKEEEKKEDKKQDDQDEEKEKKKVDEQKAKKEEENKPKEISKETEKDNKAKKSEQNAAKMVVQKEKGKEEKVVAKDQKQEQKPKQSDKKEEKPTDKKKDEKQKEAEIDPAKKVDPLDEPDLDGDINTSAESLGL